MTKKEKVEIDISDLAAILKESITYMTYIQKNLAKTEGLFEKARIQNELASFEHCFRLATLPLLHAMHRVPLQKTILRRVLRNVLSEALPDYPMMRKLNAYNHLRHLCKK